MAHPGSSSKACKKLEN